MKLNKWFETDTSLSSSEFVCVCEFAFVCCAHDRAVNYARCTVCSVYTIRKPTENDMNSK